MAAKRKRSTSKRTSRKKAPGKKAAKRKKSTRKKSTRKTSATAKKSTRKKSTRKKSTRKKGATSKKKARKKTGAGTTTRGATLFDVEMVPADHGDCLIITYGSKAKPSRVLIDCGTQSTVSRLEKRLLALKPSVKKFDLFVLTHVDADHIGGSIDFFNDGAGGLEFDDVWFNGWEHMPGRQFLSAKQGEVFTVLLEKNNQPWNEWTNGKAIQVTGDVLPTRELAGGMKITLLSPTPARLKAMAKEWAKELKKHGFVKDGRIDERARKQHYRQFLGGISPTMSNVLKLADSKFKNDTSKPNGSSIGFLAEFGGRRVLFSGDAYAPVLAESIRKLLRKTGEDKLHLDAFKIPHHGSRGNISKDLLELIDCDNYLVSTSGAIFKHPDGEALSRVVVYGGDKPTLHFNYSTKFNAFWAGKEAQKKFGFSTKFPAKGKEGIVVSL